MDCEHFLNESPPKMEQPQGERPFVLCLQGLRRLLQELAQVRPHFNRNGRFTPAGGACFNKDAVDHFAWSAEVLSIGEAVISTESADGLAFAFNKRQGGMLPYGVPELLQFSVNRSLTQGRLK